jgi:hypothetical protein
MDKIVIADIGVEGGGTTIYGARSQGVWSFWTEGTSIDLDEDDHEVWRSWSTEPVSSLELLVPNDWPMYYPSAIHPEFLGWFRDHYEKAQATLSENQCRYQLTHRHRKWLRVLDLAP